MTSAKVVLKKNSKFTFAHVIEFFDWSLTKATAQNVSASKLQLVGTYEGKAVVVDVLGKGFTYSKIGGYSVLSGGTITKVSVKVGGVDVGTITTKLAAKSLASAVYKDLSGIDPGALEKFLMAVNWTFHDSDATGVLPTTINGVPVNLRGNDKIYLYGGNDTVSAGDGNDLVKGGDGNDTILGQAGNDKLFGENGNDTLHGGAGNDTIDGGKGRDTLFGGTGKDQFVFRKLSDSTPSTKGMDTIGDFSRAERDKINLKAIDADVTKAGNQSFVFIGENKFSKKAGELKLLKKGGATYVQGDVDGDGKADFVIKLTGAIDLQAGDFVL